MASNFSRTQKNIIKSIFQDVINLESHEFPCLAHYTSLEAFEKIIQYENFLLSHPLFMNDTQELNFGLSEGQSLINNLINDNAFIENFGNQPLFKQIIDNTNSYFTDFNNDQFNSVYVLCFAEYDKIKNPFGPLSMWRGYGANGQGAALLLNTNFYNQTSDPHFLLGKVKYASNQKRKEQLKDIYMRIFNYYKNENEKTGFLADIASTLHVTTLVFSLLNKHEAFQEENEWRLVYIPEMDNIEYHKNYQTYLISNNTIQPKLDVKIQFFNQSPDNTRAPNQKLYLPIYRLLLGPSHNSPLALKAAEQMLIKIGKKGLIDKLVSADIPYRANSHR